MDGLVTKTFMQKKEVNWLLPDIGLDSVLSFINDRTEYIPFHNCLEWTGSKTKSGYGTVSVLVNGKYKVTTAHRLLFMLTKRIIIDKFTTIDHLCKNTSCVNIDHLEPVSYAENNYRSNGISGINKRKKECKNGHSFDENNTYYKHQKNGLTGRTCRKCASLYQRKLRHKVKYEQYSS